MNDEIPVELMLLHWTTLPMKTIFYEDREIFRVFSSKLFEDISLLSPGISRSPISTYRSHSYDFLKYLRFLASASFNPIYSQLIRQNRSLNIKVPYLLIKMTMDRLLISIRNIYISERILVQILTICRSFR